MIVFICLYLTVFFGGEIRQYQILFLLFFITILDLLRFLTSADCLVLNTSRNNAVYLFLEQIGNITANATLVL